MAIVVSQTFTSTVSARTLLTTALRMIGVLASGQTLDADDADDGLIVLNNIVDAWNSERLNLFATTDATATFSGASATIGTAMTIATSRPLRIESAFYRKSGLDYPLRVINADEYYAIGQKTLSGDYPEVIYYESTAPTGTVYVWPVPASTEYHLQLLSQLTEFADLDTVYNFAPGYKKTLTYTLAEELCSFFTVPVPPKVERTAINSRRILKRSNATVPANSILLPSNNGRINILSNQ